MALLRHLLVNGQSNAAYVNDCFLRLRYFNNYIVNDCIDRYLFLVPTLDLFFQASGSTPPSFQISEFLCYFLNSQLKVKWHR